MIASHGLGQECSAWASMLSSLPLAGAEPSSALQHAILALVMPTSKRHFAPAELQFLTSSTYRRAKLFESDRFRRSFVEVLGQLRTEMGFLLIGWVLMPDHFHLLIKYLNDSSVLSMDRLG